MYPGFQADLSFLFETPSLWLTLVETLIVIAPLAVALAGYARWRVGDRAGLLLILWVGIYLVWMHWPQPLVPELVMPGRMISMLGWLLLMRAWARGLDWHEPLLLVSNGIVVTILIWLVLVLLVAALRNYLGWSPAP